MIWIPVNKYLSCKLSRNDISQHRVSLQHWASHGKLQPGALSWICRLGWDSITADRMESSASAPVVLLTPEWKIERKIRKQRRQ